MLSILLGATCKKEARSELHILYEENLKCWLDLQGNV